MSIDPYLLVRAASIYIATATALVVWVWRRPHRRAVAGAVLATVWNLPVLLGLHVAASRLGWWTFDARGGLLLGLPVDLYLAWACLWGLVPALAFPSVPLPLLAAAALAADLVWMPAAAPVVRLEPSWISGELVAIVAAFVPAQLLARWTARDDRLGARATLQVFAFSGLVLFVLPAVIIQGTTGTWVNPLSRPAWQFSVWAHLLAVPAVLGLTAVQEFVERGGGTPVPFDPPRRLVTTGIYAYLANPMQLAAVLILILFGAALGNTWLAASGVMAHLYSVGLAGWDEDADLRARFGENWQQYCRAVPRWIPRWRPWRPAGDQPARLFVAEGCGMCREVGGWFMRRRAVGLLIVAAESHPSGSLTRITYEPTDGSRAATGVEAMARALEHVHFGWAMLGFAVRLPIVRPAVQLLIDASGGEARSIPAVTR